MRASVLAAAAIPLTALTISAVPAAADTVVRREVTITRDVPSRLVERRYYRAPEVRYYTAPRTTYVAPRRYYYTTDSYYNPAPRYRYTSTYYYNSPTYYYDSPVDYYDAGYTYTAIGNGCDAIYRRAVATGSTYWWDRYSECTE